MDAANANDLIRQERVAAFSYVKALEDRIAALEEQVKAQDLTFYQRLGGMLTAGAGITLTFTNEHQYITIAQPPDGVEVKVEEVPAKADAPKGEYGPPGIKD